MDIYEEIRRYLLAGDARRVKELTEKALALGHPAETILEKGLMMGVDMISAKFRTQDVSVPETLQMTRALNSGLRVVTPAIPHAKAKHCKALLGTVEGDLHDIGKNLVRVYLETLGIEVIDLGVDVPQEAFVEAVEVYRPSLVMLSALLTTTVPEIGATIDAIKEAGLRDQVIIFAGGMSVTEQIARTAGADYYTRDALELREFLKGNLQKLLKSQKSKKT